MKNYRFKIGIDQQTENTTGTIIRVFIAMTDDSLEIAPTFIMTFASDFCLT